MLERLLLAFVLLGLTPAAAHGPTPQKADEEPRHSRVPGQVWKLVGEFGGIAGWHPLVKQANGNRWQRVGGRARAHAGEGRDHRRSSTTYDAAARRISYRLSKENIEVLPVSFYTATIEVKPAGSGSEVSWGARFYRADTSNFPPDELNDEAAIVAMTDFIRKGLEGLKARPAEQ